MQAKKPIRIPKSLVDHTLLGPARDRRQLQDSPLLGDVWAAYANEPAKPQELLITPHRVDPEFKRLAHATGDAKHARIKGQTVGQVAAAIDRRVDRGKKRERYAEIACVQGVIAARLYFDEILKIVAPMTSWWSAQLKSEEMRKYMGLAEGMAKISEVLQLFRGRLGAWAGTSTPGAPARELTAFERYAALAGLVHWAAGTESQIGKDALAVEPRELCAILEGKEALESIAKGLSEVFNEILDKHEEGHSSAVFQVSLNREAKASIARSVPAVKADAARALFSVDCRKIAWAVLDSGIEARHPAFRGEDGKPRVKRCFDFGNFRKIASLDNRRILNKPAGHPDRQERLALLCHPALRHKQDEDAAAASLLKLADRAEEGQPTDWDLVEPFVELDVPTPPKASDHGTHVAGTLGARKDENSPDSADGMCPTIQLYDFRVLSADLEDTEFAIIAALQYIRYLNQRNEYITIHGANLSLSIAHNVRNYACGRTPVCIECERLVDSGVVVVVAAGNEGYHEYETKGGIYAGYAPLSITDPGNAGGVITVGATHRYSPHTYGVSFFSSRGPTGDGRLKPDLVAPGERIRAPFRDGWGDLDGTSMAAPHVSGAAAMLMARYPDLTGQPARVKRLLCESATDLGRERTFQGHGMLDVLRAFQSI